MNTDNEDGTGEGTPRRVKSPDFYKTQRSTAKRFFTKTVNSIEQKIAAGSSKETMELLRDQVGELMNQSLLYHTRYIATLAPTGEALEREELWANNVDTAAQAAFEAINKYIEGLKSADQEDETDQTTTKRTRVEQDEQSDSLALAKRKRLQAEEALRESELDAAKKIEEIKRKAEERRAELEEEVRRQRAAESILEKTISTENILPSGSSTPLLQNHSNNGWPMGDPSQSLQIPNHMTAVNFNWLTTLLPKIEITPFNGDPRLWRSFSRFFKELIHDVMPTNTQRIVALRNMLAPEVRNGLEQMLRNPNNYERVIEELRNKYGDPYLITRAYLQGLQRIKTCRDGDNSSLQELAAQLHDATSGLQDENCTHMCSGPSLELVVEKLPSELRRKWGMYAYRRRPTMLTLTDLDTWLQEKVIGETWTRPTFERDRASRRTGVYTTGEPTTQYANTRTNNDCQICGSTGHPLYECGTFIAAPLETRVRMVMREGSCFRCLGRKHISADCKRTTTCSIRNCGRNHHPLLHGAIIPKKRNDESTGGPPPLTGANACHATSTPTFNKHQVVLPIVTVKIRAGDRSLVVLALLDTGSQVTLVHEDAVRYLGVDGEREVIHLTTFHGEDPEIVVKKVCFIVESLNGDHSLVANGLAVPRLNVANGNVNWDQEKTHWSHLKDLKLPRTDLQPVQLLVGMDLLDAHIPLEIRRPAGGERGPYAFRGIFGWTVCGKRHHRGTDKLNCYTTSLDELLTRLFEVDTRAPIITEEGEFTTPSEKRALKILDTTTQDIGGRYEVGLLWATDSPKIPNNRPIAMQRLFANESRFERDPAYAAHYSKIINEYITLGFARKLQHSELLQGPEGLIHYLIHFGITNPNKPGHLRVVFNAAQKYLGTSLNDLLLPGPDLLTSLVGVLIRSRKAFVGVSADIEKMFHQVRVPEKDQSVLRFLWREPGSRKAPNTYQMCVQIFGATSSPTCCTWALRKAASDQPDFGQIERVKKNFYVDNYLDSFDDEEDAIREVRRLTEMLRRKGFRLNQWNSSSRKVLNSIPPTERTHSKLNIDLDRLPIERTLGMYWDCELDVFTFTFQPPKEVKTKRDMFSAAATIFDPLGFICPVVLPIKITMQEAWRRGISWNDELPRDLLQKWNDWCRDLVNSSKLYVPRCFRPRDFPIDDCEVQLHMFADASKDGYGAVAYLRYVRRSRIHVVFAMGKSRVAPVRQLTTPKLELNAAWTSVELARLVTREIDLPISEHFFWTDSTTVLHWINSSRSKSEEFVANRLTHILNHSNPNQWRHVPSEQNPADDCSRGFNPTKLSLYHRWFTGPAFLDQTADFWPSQANWKKEVTFQLDVHTTTVDEPNAVRELMAKADSLDQLKQDVCRLLAKNETLPGELKLSPQDYNTAIEECIREAQREFYKKDVTALEKMQPLPKDSRLKSLSPYLDDKGILRVGGRLEHAELEEETRFPIIIPHEHPLAVLIIRSSHELVRHGGKVRTLSDTRSKYWITKGLATTGKVVRDCLECRKEAAKSEPPIMGPLPRHRLQSHLPPFTNTGLDYFGPFHVVLGRRHEKRYGVLFTCLTTRAVHLEMASSLSSDSFIAAFRRFVNRRGMPAVVYSDNGTNLTAGEKEMREAIRLLNSHAAGSLPAKGVEWHFSPPSAPHFGGVWERLVKSCKTALKHVLRGQCVTDEILYTALTEVEALLNGRPLTHVSVDPKDPHPLTPNHFLLGRPYPNLPVALISPKERLSSKSWRRAQQIVDSFWRRWLTEYVPALTEKKKWTEKKRDLLVGDLVLVADKKNERGTWPVGRVTKVMPGPDGVVRTAVVKTDYGEYVRPAIKLFVFHEAASEETQPLT